MLQNLSDILVLCIELFVLDLMYVNKDKRKD